MGLSRLYHRLLRNKEKESQPPASESSTQLEVQVEVQVHSVHGQTQPSSKWPDKLEPCPELERQESSVSLVGDESKPMTCGWSLSPLDSGWHHFLVLSRRFATLSLFKPPPGSRKRPPSRWTQGIAVAPSSPSRLPPPLLRRSRLPPPRFIPSLAVRR